ncbi:MAG: DUF1549 and DUF1553 domain-containing protein [Planctomycetota bacterium]|nr:DUF1549 and DUF1553 domain-containing protein [Planctomycetota bacterium]
MRSCLALLIVLIVSPVRCQNYQESPILDEDREHWSFMPIQRPPLPDLRNDKWSTNPIDTFIFEKLNKAGLQPTPVARQAELVRRVYLDLTGLPPDYDEAISGKGYEQIVDELLSSPRFGERQAQHWLDLARFAETDGFEHDQIRVDSWRYRDWVIQAFNRNLHYDQFIRQQLAADELGDSADRVATMFCLSGPDMPDINSQSERRDSLLNEMTSTVGAVFMGLQVGCAQCHDHKFDPISQADFYRLRAIFQPAVHVVKNKSISTLREQGEPGKSHLMIRGDFNKPGMELRPSVPRVVSGTKPVAIKKTEAGTSGRRLALANWLVENEHPLTARVIVNRIWQQHFGQGLVSTLSDFGVMGTSPTHPQFLDWLAAELQSQQWDLKVIHRMIVTSSTYRQASEGGDIFEKNKTVDPDNVLFSRFPRQRLNGEAIRDLMLVAAGLRQYEMGGPGVRPPIQKEVAQTLLKNQWDVSPNQRDHYRRSIYIFARRNLRYPMFEAFDRPDANVSCPQRQKSTTAPQALILFNSKLSLDLARRMAGDILRTIRDDDEFVREVLRRCWSREPQADIVDAARAFFAKSRRDALRNPIHEINQVIPTPKPPGLDARDAAVYSEFCLVAFNTLEFIVIR